MTLLNYTPLHYTTLHYITLHSLHHKCNCNYTTLITQHRSYNSTTPQLQLQLHNTTLHPAVVGEVTDQVTTATIATTPNNTTPTTFQSIRGFALPSVIHNNQALLEISCSATSAIALCGTTGMIISYLKSHYGSLWHYGTSHFEDSLSIDIWAVFRAACRCFVGWEQDSPFMDCSPQYCQIDPKLITNGFAQRHINSSHGCGTELGGRGYPSPQDFTVDFASTCKQTAFKLVIKH